MEIKPTGPGGSLPSVSNNEQQVTNKNFSRQMDGAPAAGAAAPASNSPLSAVLAQYKKSDLQDPAKVDQMLSACTGSLLTDAAGRSDSPLSSNESSYLSNYLQNDPTMRGKLMSYLERVLK